MKSPYTGNEMLVQKETRTLVFRKEEFEVCFHTYKCNETGEQFEDEQFAQLNYIQLLNKYREKYAIPFPEEIKTIREQYGLSASKMSEVLGFGTHSYRQYEAGEIPSHSNARLIQLSANTHEFEKLVKLSNAISGSALEKLNQRITIIRKEEKLQKQTKAVLEYLFGKSQANCHTGYIKPSLKKFAQMVIYFSQELKPQKTKLNKLLFYSDFTHFKKTGFSISGATYNAIPMGPVPNNFQSIYEYIANNGVVEIKTINYTDEIVGEQFVPATDQIFDDSLFSESELISLHEISERFKDVSTQKIIDISHQEAAWLANHESKKPIDYFYAFDLK